MGLGGRHLITLDLALSVVMPGMVPGFGAHLAHSVVPSYLVVPIITTPTMGYLERRFPQPKSSTQALPLGAAASRYAG